MVNKNPAEKWARDKKICTLTFFSSSQEITTLFCLARIVYSFPSPYQFNSFTALTSPPPYTVKQNLNSDSPTKFNVGYKSQDGPSNKVKKEYSNAEYLFMPENKRAQTFSPDYGSFDEFGSPNGGPSAIQFAYPGGLKLSPPPGSIHVSKPAPSPATASNKVFVHHHDHLDHHDKPHFIHDVVGHYITDVAGHKLKHYGEALESGALTEPIIHKLSFAKAALLQLLAIIGPLSAIKTIHVVAKASEPHEPEHIEAVPGPFPGEHIESFAPHHAPPYPPTLVGMILHFIGSLSKFNKDAKLHLIPNLLRVVSHASAASSHVSAHHHH